ncbi:TonB-dependent receptor [Bacteroidota bacterium]
MKILKTNGIFLFKKKKLKLLLIMKFIIILNIICFSLIASSGFSQKAKLEFDLGNQTLKEFLLNVEEKSDYRFFYNEEYINLDKEINVTSKNNTIEEALDEIFENEKISFRILEDNLIVITPKEYLEAIKITGTITSSEDGSTLPGVNILEVGTSNGAITDMEGNYSITVQEAGALLRFSFVGYISQEVLIKDQTIINISLDPAVEALDEVVVVGYGVQKKSDLTGVVSSIKAEDIQKLAVSSIDNAIQGKASGVYVLGNSGQPGEGAKIYVRGQGSINNTDPIWIIDGVKSSAGVNFNMNDVESIEILKDASSAAIYGVEAANGVILVTTKRGKKGEPIISFSSYHGMNSPTNLPKLLGTEDFAYVKNTARDAEELERIPRIADENNLPETSTDWFDEIFNPAPMHNYDLSVSSGTERMNFFISGNYYSETGTMINTDYERYSVRANSDFKIKKKIKIGETIYLNKGESTGFFNPEDPYRRNNLDDLVRAIPTMPVYDATNKYGGYGYADPVLDSYLGRNPYANIDLNDFKTNNYSFKGNAYIDLEIIKDLHIKATGGSDMNFSYNNLYRAPFYFSSSMFDSTAEIRQSLKILNEFSGNIIMNYSKTIGSNEFALMIGVEARKTDYDFFYARGQEFAGGMQILDAGKQVNKDNGGNKTLERVQSQFSRFNYSYEGKYLLTVNVRRDGSSKFGEQSKWGVFPSFSTGWNIHKEGFMEGFKFISNLKLRGGWGKLGSDRIPSFLSSEVYMTYPLYYVTGDPSILAEGAAIAKFPNKGVKWEEINQYDFGLDLALFEGKLQATIDYYEKKTKDMLIPVKLPPSAGFHYGYDAGDESDLAKDPSLNLGEIMNRGIELSLEYKKKIEDFNFSIGGNIAYNKNEVLKLNKNQIIDAGYMTLLGSAKVCRIEAGYPVAYFYGYEIEKIFQTQEEVDAANQNAREMAYQEELRNDPNTTATIDDFDRVNYYGSWTGPGDYKWKDIAGKDADGNIIQVPDGRITDADKTMIGNPWPKWIFGINLNTSWKAFDLSLFGQGVLDRDVCNGFRFLLENAAGDGNYGEAILDSWTPDNTDTDVSRITLSDPNKNASNVSTRYIEDASYFKLKNIQLGFTLPKKYTMNLGLSNLRIYVSGQNLLTITNYSGMDPEFSVNEETDNLIKGIDRGYYPHSKSVIVGFQIDF